MATTLPSLPTYCLSLVASFLPLPSLAPLISSCNELLLPSLLEYVLQSRAAAGTPLPCLLPSRSIADDAPLPQRLVRLRELVSALVAAVRCAHGMPSAHMAISWGETQQYWTRSSPEPSSPYGVVASLRHVCWLDLSGETTLSPGAYLAALRVRSTGLWGAELRMALTPGDPGEARVELEQPFAAAGGSDGPGLAVGSLQFGPGGAWLWLHVGGVTVRPRGYGAAGGGEGSGQGWGAAQREAARAAGDPGARVCWHVWDHSGPWKTGLHVDRLEWVPRARAESWAAQRLAEGAGEEGGSGAGERPGGQLRAWRERGWAREA